MSILSGPKISSHPRIRGTRRGTVGWLSLEQIEAGDFPQDMDARNARDLAFFLVSSQNPNVRRDELLVAMSRLLPKRPNAGLLPQSSDQFVRKVVLAGAEVFDCISQRNVPHDTVCRLFRDALSKALLSGSNETASKRAAEILSAIRISITY